MKTLSIIRFAMIAVALITLSACGSSKKAVKPVPEQKLTGAVELSLPFTGKEFKSDEKFFREKAQGKSPDQATAKKIAMTNAITELGVRVQNTLKMVRDNYTQQHSTSEKQDFGNKFNELARIVVNQELGKIDVLDEKAFREANGSYTYWVVIEMPKDLILKGLSDGISNDAKLKLDFDKFQFEKIFNEEMEKFEEQ